ncbi:peptidoglycan-binding domain-containing protein [Streptomyces clavifer]|uniref:peptidoglycan-binding domain-containing protein n=1 Tax=Streptomyces clavifer TaxID=68188 RepID=UPI0033BC1A41
MYNGKWNCTMPQGASGDHVRALQKTLKSCYGQNITVDGDFGQVTKSALKSGQNMTDPMYPNVDIVGDGVYGPITAKYLSHYATRNGSALCGALH